jgi:hypothetical protein
MAMPLAGGSRYGRGAVDDRLDVGSQAVDPGRGLGHAAHHVVERYGSQVLGVHLSEGSQSTTGSSDRGRFGQRTSEAAWPGARIDLASVLPTEHIVLVLEG